MSRRTNAQHMAGPWSLSSNRRSPVRLLAPGGECLALVYLTDYKTRKRAPEYAKNASLIAAAPEVYEALLSLTEALEGLGFGTDDDISGSDTVDTINCHWDSICAAIAKVG